MGGSLTILGSGTYETLTERVVSSGYTAENLEGDVFIDIVRNDDAETGLVGVVSDSLGPLGVSLSGLLHEIEYSAFGRRLSNEVLQKFYKDTLRYEEGLEICGELEVYLDTIDMGFSADTVMWSFFGVDSTTPAEYVEGQKASQQAGVDE